MDKYEGVISDLFFCRYPSVDSTNLEAKRLAQSGASAGTIVVAESQTSGRGSQGRHWSSPPGGLYLSVLLTAKQVTRATDLVFVAGIATARAIETIAPGLSVTLKWPNDCLLNQKKVAGILCENLGEPFGGLCVVGLGVNVNPPRASLIEFESNAFSATSLELELGTQAPKLPQVEYEVIAELLKAYRLYCQEGFLAIRKAWSERADSTQGIDDRGGLVLYSRA